MKKGFTLIELLAVIVILAIIALIATPIVLNIINDSKESAIIRSAEFYADAVKNSIANKLLKDPSFKIEDGTYNIMKDGNICLGTHVNNECNDEILMIEINGEKPAGGEIEINNGNIINSNIIFGDKVVINGTIEEYREPEPTPAECFGTKELEDGTLEIKEYYCGEGTSDEELDVVIPSYINDKKVTGIEGNVWYDESGELFIHSAFKDSGIASIVIPSTVTYIGESAFLESTIESITIPNSVTTIGSEAFNSCYNLTNITIPSSVTSIGHAAFFKSGLESITIPSSVTTIEDQVFAYCENLTSVKLSEGLTNIEYSAFIGSAIESITIPSSVTSIGQNAFRNCDNLTTIYYKGTATGSPWSAPNATVITDF